MKNLFNLQDSREVLERIDKLTPQTQRLWGKMDVAQMLAHCSVLMRIARGIDKPKRIPLGIILGPLFKKSFFGDKPYPKDSPTHPSYIVAEEKKFEEEKQTLKEHIKAFSQGGPAACTTHPNPFFGKLSPEEWARGQYKHIDHHLKQFGV